MCGVGGLMHNNNTNPEMIHENHWDEFSLKFDSRYHLQQTTTTTTKLTSSISY